MPCLWCTAMRRRTATNGELVDKYGDMQAGSRARGTLRTADHFAKMAATYATGNNDTLPKRLTLEEHLSVERRPLMVIPPDHISPMPLHLTLGVTVWLLRLTTEAVYFYNGLEQGQAYVAALASLLGQSMGVSPAPYFGGAFEGRQCQRIARRMEMVCTLIAGYVPEAAAAAFSGACTTWREIISVLTRVQASSPAEVVEFRRHTATFVDGLLDAFPWSTVTPKMHALCCHAPDFLNRFGSLGRYSEQGIEAWHGHFNHTAVHHPAGTFLESCRSYVTRSAMSRAPGDEAHNRGKRRAPAKAGAGARAAKRTDDKRTTSGMVLAGVPRLMADSCAQKRQDDAEKWARDMLGEAVTKIETYRGRVPASVPRVAVTGDDGAPFTAADIYGELLEGDTASLMGLLEDYSG